MSTNMREEQMKQYLTLESSNIKQTENFSVVKHFLDRVWFDANKNIWVSKNIRVSLSKNGLIRYARENFKGLKLRIDK